MSRKKRIAGCNLNYSTLTWADTEILDTHVRIKTIRDR